MKNHLLRVAVVAGIGTIAMTGATGVASAFSMYADTDDGPVMLILNPQETKFIANTPIPGLLGFVPDDKVIAGGGWLDDSDYTPWSPEKSHQLFNDAAVKNESVHLGWVDFEHPERRGLSIIRVGHDFY